MLASTKRIRRDSGLRPAVLAPVHEHLARPQTLGHRGRDQLGHRRFQLLCNAFGQYHRAPAAHRLVQRAVEVQPLAAAGERKRGQTDVGDQIPNGACHLGELRHRHTLAGVEVEHQTGRRAGLEFFTFSRPLGDEAPLRHVHLERGLLGDPRQPVGAVDDRIRRRPGPVRNAGAGQPIGSRRGQLLFEKRRLLDAIGPALAGGRAPGDVRHHHLGDIGVVVEDVGLGGCPVAG